MAKPNVISRRRSTASNLTTQTLLDFDLEESSSDSDFRIEDADEESDDLSNISNDEDCDDEDECIDKASTTSSDFMNNCLNMSPSPKYEGGTTHSSACNSQTLNFLLRQNNFNSNMKLANIPICCACLGNRSDDTNEIVECDGCGISVHEGCYGINDTCSISSTVSSCSTEPWFCEPCKAGIVDPLCELCPNKGGIFKETDIGRWVHLICALYIPGVAFGEVDQLSSVTLFEMQYSKWGAKCCSLCEDMRMARTGVCIGCDAGMCKTYFHVTCAQAAGLLSEAHSEEADHADPFYAHCKIHSDKSHVKQRKRNYSALQLRKNKVKQNSQQKLSHTQQRIQRKLKKHRNKYAAHKLLRTNPWVPTQKMPRLLNTSASACRKLILKADLLEINTRALEFQEIQISSLIDIRKKWHLPAAFSVEFIGYYLDRIIRIKEIKADLHKRIILHTNLLDEQNNLKEMYDLRYNLRNEQLQKNTQIKANIDELHAAVLSLCPGRPLPDISGIGRPPIIASTLLIPQSVRPMSVPTAAALKMGVGFPLTNLPGTNDDTNRVLSTHTNREFEENKSELLNECGICKRYNDQHMFTTCDTCNLHYHLGCLNPPLVRQPKKSKLYGWQCSECDKSDNSDSIGVLHTGPRKSRTKYAKDGSIVPVDANYDNTAERVVLERKTFKSSSESINKPLIKVENVNDIVLKRHTPVVKLKSINQCRKPIDGIEIDEKNMLHMNIDEAENNIDPLHIDGIEAQKQKAPCTLSEQALPPVEKCCIRDDRSGSYNDSSRTISVHGRIKRSKNIQPDEEKVNRKRRKDKHRNRYCLDSDNQSSLKEHKKKRKRRCHEIENPRDNYGTTSGIPKIKIKLKAVQKPGETTAEPQFFYVSADLVRPRTRPNSQNELSSTDTTETSTLESNTKTSSMERGNINRQRTSAIHLGAKPKQSNSVVPNQPTTVNSFTLPIRSRRLSVILPRTSASFVNCAQLNKNYALTSKLHSKKSPTPISYNFSCCVCHQKNISVELVKCDVCKKSYHFGCLDPPLKKTPKRRGYSWHCADCDPTEDESN